MNSPTCFINCTSNLSTLPHKQYLSIAVLSCDICEITQLQRVGLVPHIFHFYDELPILVSVIRNANTSVNSKACFLRWNSSFEFSGLANVRRLTQIMNKNTTGTNIVSMEILDLEVEDLNRLIQLLTPDRIDKGIFAVLAHSSMLCNSTIILTNAYK